jgi:hypothetical protein
MVSAALQFDDTRCLSSIPTDTVADFLYELQILNMVMRGDLETGQMIKQYRLQLGFSS